jgi:hypothetical protein
VCSTVAEAVELNLTRTLVEIGDKVRPFLVPTPPRTRLPRAPQGVLNLQQSERVVFLAGFLNNISINSLVNATTGGTGVASFAALLRQAVPLQFAPTDYATIEVGIETLNVGGLNTFSKWDPMVLAGPISISASLANAAVAMETALYVKLSSSRPALAAHSVVSRLVASLNVTGAELVGWLDVAADERAVTRRAAAKQPDSCFRDVIQNISVPGVAVAMETVDATVRVGQPGHDADGPLAVGLDRLSSQLFQLLVDGYKGHETAVANALLITPFAESLSDSLQASFGSDEPCPAITHTNGDMFVNGVSFSFGVGFLICVTLVSMMAYWEGRKCWRKRFGVSKWSDEFNVIDPEKVPLFLDGRVPLMPRIGMMCGIVMNCAIFISANLATAVDVYPVVTIGDERPIEFASLVTLNLGSTISTMWKAEVYPLGVLLLVLSGIWPYGKLVAMAACWLVPPKNLSTTNRAWMLEWLNVLGKWSLVNVYVLAMMMVAFRYHVETTVVLNSGQSVRIAFDLFVLAKYGFFAFLIATFQSVVFSHVMLHCHRHAVARDVSEASLAHKSAKIGAAAAYYDREEKTSGGYVGRQSLVDQPFDWRRDGEGAIQDARITTTGKVCAVLVLVAAIAMVAVGVSIPSFEFEFRGFAGELLGDRNKVVYSLASLGSEVRGSVANPGFWEVLIQLLLFAFVIGTPVLYILVLLVLWHFPLHARRKRWFFNVAEILQAWSTLDVFSVTLLATVYQIRQLATYLVDDQCEALDELLGDRCFDFVASLDEGCALLFPAVFIAAVMAYCIMRIANYSINKRVLASHGGGGNGDVGLKVGAATPLIVHLSRSRLRAPPTADGRVSGGADGRRSVAEVAQSAWWRIANHFISVPYGKLQG